VERQRIIVISDLHISAGKLDDFDKELEAHFVHFLEELGRRKYPLELVINGDFLDFVQAPPYGGPDLQSQSNEKVPLCFTQAQSRQKLSAIHASHEPTFQALNRFLTANADNALVVLPGNHDPDFFWPNVRDDFVRHVSGGDTSLARRVRIHLESAYQPSQCPGVWIEHGQQYDPINSFSISEYPYWSENNPPILSDGHQHRLYACLGTRFLIDYLNDLDADYPFVDNVKPFSRFVRLFLASSADSRFGPVRAAVASWRILKYLMTLGLRHPKDLLGISQIEDGTSTTLIERLKTMPKTNKKQFARINEAFPGDRDLRLLLNDSSEQERILQWLANHLELLDEPQAVSKPSLLSIDGTDDQYLSLGKGFQMNETALLVDAAIKRLGAKDRRIQLVVMGHTHEPVEKPEGLNYFNTGSWTRYYRFGGDDHPSAWSILQEESYKTFPYKLNYVEIGVHDPSAAEMCCFKGRDHD
jgi:UDP-2,3-diacylglucosamine pyrophosphatase LpxH